MQAIEPDCQRHTDTTHDERLDVIECDLEMRDAGSTHAARLRPSISRGQCHGNNSSRRDAG